MPVRLLRRRALAAGTGGLTAAVATAVLSRHPPGDPAGWRQRNYRGAVGSLAAGPAITVAAGTSAALGVLVEDPAGGFGVAARRRVAVAALGAGLAAGALGRYDDLAGSRDAERGAKGFAGHLRALRRGRVTAGVVKVAGISAAGLAAGWALATAVREGAGAADGLEPARSGGSAPLVLDAVVRAGVVAATANLVNLFDLRPGRALKVTLLVAGPLAVRPTPVGSLLAGPVGAALAALPGDLAERTMLGDAGANGLGAVLGVGLATATGASRRLPLLAALVGLTAASEVVSFSRVIDATPPLRWLDRTGRRAGINRPTPR